MAQWRDEGLHSPPASDQPLKEGMILVAAGSPTSMQRLSEIARPITEDGTIVVVGYGDVGSKLVEMLRDANEDVRVIDETGQPGVDVVGEAIDSNVYESSAAGSARVIILALENDSASLLAATVAREFTDDVPIIACAVLEENVARIQKAGADFALSLSQVAGQLLAHHVLGGVISQQAHIKMVKVDAARLVGQHPHHSGIREKSGCSVVAVERNSEIIMEFSESFRVEEGDALYVCGIVGTFEKFYEDFTPADKEVSS